MFLFDFSSKLPHIHSLSGFVEWDIMESNMKATPIVYLDIPTPDIEKADSFFSTVFGWDINRSGLSDAHEYWMFNSGEDSLSGGFNTSKSP